MGQLIKFLIIGLLAMFAVGVVFSIVGVAIALTLKLIPVVLVGYVVYKVFGPKKPKPPEISEADRKWLES